jgi:hypothetical protein
MRMPGHDASDCDRHHCARIPARYDVRIKSMGESMTKLFVIAALVSAALLSAASAETPPAPAETNSPAPVEAPTRPMVRNIGIAEQGDAIIVRQRKAEPVPATDVPAIRPEQK